MSYHYSGPDFTCPHGDARLDFCDLFTVARGELRGTSLLLGTWVNRGYRQKFKLAEKLPFASPPHPSYMCTDTR
jgi:hypothetical protein